MVSTREQRERDKTNESSEDRQQKLYRLGEEEEEDQS